MAFQILTSNIEPSIFDTIMKQPLYQGESKTASSAMKAIKKVLNKRQT